MVQAMNIFAEYFACTRILGSTVQQEGNHQMTEYAERPCMSSQGMGKIALSL